jgi:hypothetical protein
MLMMGRHADMRHSLAGSRWIAKPKKLSATGDNRRLPPISTVMTFLRIVIPLYLFV